MDLRLGLTHGLFLVFGMDKRACVQLFGAFERQCGILVYYDVICVELCIGAVTAGFLGREEMIYGLELNQYC